MTNRLAIYQETLGEFEAAYMAVPDPAFLFNIAQCHRKAGHDKEAIAFYKSYLRNAPRPPTGPTCRNGFKSWRAASTTEGRVTGGSCLAWEWKVWKPSQGFHQQSSGEPRTDHAERPPNEKGVFPSRN